MEYKASYTAGGLLYDEINALRPVLLQPDWSRLLENDVKENRLLRINSEASRKRVAQEVVKRRPYMNDEFWSVYDDVSVQDRKALLFYICLKTYNLVYDFHFNITVPKFLSMETAVQTHWYEMRLQEISSGNPQVDGWTEQTKRKVITRYIDMLKKVGLVEQGKLAKNFFSNTVLCFFLNKGDVWALDAFFLKQGEKEAILNFCDDH